MTLEKRGNSEIEIKNCGGQMMMVLPGSDQTIPYDGRFDKDGGFMKVAAIQEGRSEFFEV